MSDKINSDTVDNDNISDDKDFISPSDNDSDGELQRFRKKSKSIEWKLVERKNRLNYRRLLMLLFSYASG